jgi:uncharacterized protein YjaG (DUF416 family)
MLSYQEGLQLGLAISKRLFFEYRAFVHETGWGNPDVLLDALSYIESGGVDPNVMEHHQVEIEQVTPDSDDFGDSASALNACTAIFNLLAFAKGPNDQSLLYEVGIAYYDTIDEKVQEEEDLSEEEMAKHPFLIEAKRFLLNKEAYLP